jgi:hypothetical protein
MQDSNDTLTQSSSPPVAVQSGGSYPSWWSRATVLLHKTIGLCTALYLLPWTLRRYESGDWKPLAADGIAVITIATGKSIIDVLKAVIKPR